MVVNGTTSPSQRPKKVTYGIRVWTFACDILTFFMTHLKDFCRRECIMSCFEFYFSLEYGTNISILIKKIGTQTHLPFGYQKCICGV